MKKTTHYLTIKIDLKDKLYFVKIKWGTGSTWFAETTLKKAFKRIKEELHL